MTIKQQLIPLRIGKGLLSLVALFVMLLAPQGAWAQDPVSYGLTVAGVEVTSANATNITGQNILAGTVTYEDGSHTLTLDHATINGSVVVTGDFDLVVCLVGNSTIQGTGETSLTNGISRGGSAAGKLTFTIAENSSGSLFFPNVTTPIADFANIEYQNGLEWGCRDEGDQTDYVEGVGTDVVLASIGATYYVTKTKTTMTLSNNGGTVTYRKDDTLGHVLTLSGLTDLNNCISWYSPDDVKIEISGTNNSMSFSSSGTYNSVCFEGKPQSNISFIFTGSTATLKMYDRSQAKSLEHPWISGFSNASNPTLSDGLKMVEIDEYRYDNNQSLETYVERYITTETYGLNVKGTQVHHLDGVLVGHKDNILGLVYNEQSEKWELSTSVTFNSDDNILTLNNANINYDDGNAIVSSITSPLTVHLTGENFISSGDYLPFVGAIGDNANLVFTTNTTGTPGSLTMTSTHTDFGPTSFFDGFKQILYPEEQGLLAAKSVNGNVVISQETGYGLKVAGIVVTEDNASHILGENNATVTFTPATAATDTESAKPATLTLNNATISGIIETSIDLTVDFKGSSTIILPTNKEYPFVGNKSPVLSFTNSGKNSTPLTVNGEFNGGYSKFMTGFATGSVDVDNGCTDNTVWWLQSEITAYMYLKWIQRYDLWIGDTQFTNIDSELSGGKGSFDGDHTLTLNGASLTAPIKSNLDNLIIKLKGNNSIVETSDSATLINSYKKTATLSFDVDNELGGSLTLTNRGDGASIKNFTSVSLAEGLYIHSNQAGLRYETINNEKCYVAQQYGESWTMTINQNASYPIWVYKNSTDGYVQVTESNKANVLGEQTETKSVTYNDGTLTLNGATINSSSSYAFVMGDDMTALNVVLVGENTVVGNGFQFTSSSASLTFKTNGTAAGSLTIAEGDFVLASTGTTINYQNGLVYDATTKTVDAISAPTISSVLDGLTGERTVEIQGQSQGTVNYSLTYADSKLSANNVSNQEYSEAFKLLGPATIKATVTVNDVVSPEATAYYFGILPNPLTFVYDGQTAPTFTATLYPSVDDVTFTPTGSPDSFTTFLEGNVTITGFGRGMASANINAPETRNFTVLSDTIGFMMEVVPPTPTIAFDGTKTYLNTDKVTISLPESLADDQNAVIVYSWDEECQPGNANNYSDASGVPLNAGTNTLYAWVRYNGATADDAVYSERVSQVFTVKTDIDQFAVKDMIATDPTYTGSAIVPTFTLYDAKDETSTLSAENYDVRIEKYVDETTGYSVVTSVLDAGTYKVYAVGKGDTYGGEKLIYEALVVNKANIQGLPTVAADDLVYDGTEQVLLPITVPDGVTVEYFFTSITEENYKDGSYDPNCAGEVSYSTTIPKATNAGYFAIIYKVDGGNNYNNIMPSGTIKVAIYPAEITELTIATNSLTYTGEAQTVTITSVKAGELVLTTSDYDVSYEVVEEQGTRPVDAPVDTGTYNAVVTGKGNFTGTQSAEFTVLKDPEFCFYVDETISNGETKEYEYGLEQTLPVLKRWDNGSLKDPTGFNVTYTSSDANVATIDNTGKITIVGVGLTEIRASIEATEEYAADEAWFTMMVVPAVPKVSIPDGAYFTGQKLSITTDAQGGDLYYSYGYEEDESKRTPYDGEISLPAGEYQFYPYVRCGTDNNPIWSYTEATELYVYDEPTISKDEGEYEGDIEVEITNLPQSNEVSVTAYYYLGDDEENAKLYTAGYKITVRESTKLNVYLLVEGDSGKRYKTRVIERQYVIKDIPLDVTAADFHNHWMTYYHNNNGNVGLPENQNIGAYVATTISGNEIVVTQIKSIPRGEPVLLNDETTTTTTNVFGQDVQGNLLLHADEDVVVDEEQGDYYGLYNGAFMHVKGTIPAGKNYLMVSNAVVPGGNAPQLTIVIDGEATGVNDVRSKMEDVRGDIYDLQGRKVQKPSKKGLYINNGHKVVVK